MSWNRIFDWYWNWWNEMIDGPFAEEPYETYSNTVVANTTAEYVVRHKEVTQIDAPHLDDPKVITIKEHD